MNNKYALWIGFLMAGATLSLAQDAPVLTAARAGDAKALRRALQSPGADIHAPDERGFTPLMYTTWRLSVEEMKLLLARGADPNHRTRDQVSAFHFATDNPGKARLLLDHGLELNPPQAGIYTPLMLAARHPRGYPVATLFLKRGADVNAVGPGSRRPLFQAIVSGNLRMVRLLVDHGAEESPRSPGDENRRENPLLRALLFGHLEIARYFLDRGADVNDSDGFAGHSLTMALLTESDRIVPELLKQGADVHAANNVGGVPPIVFAAHNERGNPEMLKLLLQKGAELNARNDRDETTLTWARKRGDTELVRFLRAQGAEDPVTFKAPVIPSNPVEFTRENRERLVRESVARSLDIVQTGSRGFLDRESRSGKCISCHHQTLPGVAFGWALKLDLLLDQAILQRQIGVQVEEWRPTLQKAWAYDNPLGSVENVGYGLLNFAASGVSPGELTDSMSFYLKSVQQTDGGWHGFKGRQPSQSTPIASTALALQALQLYLRLSPGNKPGSAQGGPESICCDRNLSRPRSGPFRSWD